MTQLDNPYVGPRTFTRQERDRFFGREREANDLFSLVVSERLVLFYAQSGAGKSSLINTRLIPGYGSIDLMLQNAPWHTVNGKHYGVPYQWGPNVLMYNTKVFGSKPPTSWSVVFEETTLPDGKSNKGRVQAYDGPIYIADAALYLAVFENRLTSRVTAGENSGRTLTHDHVVLEWQGPFAFAADGRISERRRLALLPMGSPERSGVVGFVQNRRTGEVLQALLRSPC